MRKVARFVCRPNTSGRPDLLLGACFSGSVLKPGRVYEITEIMDQLVIKDIGPSVLGEQASKTCSSFPELSWLSDVSHIIDCAGKCLVATIDEFAAIVKKGLL